MTALRWLAILCLSGAAAVLPFSFWIAGWWGFVALALLLVGCAFLTSALRGSRVDPTGVEPHLHVPPGQLRGELRGFPGARVFRDGDADVDS